MRSLVTFFAGVVAGIVATLSLLAWRTDDCEIHRVMTVAMMDASIDALDMSKEGDLRPVELMLASAVSSSFVVMSKLDHLSKPDRVLLEGWRSRIAAHNKRLGVMGLVTEEVGGSSIDEEGQLRNI